MATIRNEIKGYGAKLSWAKSITDPAPISAVPVWVFARWIQDALKVPV
jgi:hypothetical protein